MKTPHAADDPPVCPCKICDRRRWLEAKRAAARDVLAGRRLFIVGPSGDLFDDDADDLKRAMAALDEEIKQIERPDHCELAKQRLDLESELADARDAFVHRRRIDAGLEERLVQDDPRDLKELIANVDEAVKKLARFDRRDFRFQQRRRWRRRRRSIGRFMARVRPWARSFAESTDPRDREATWQL